MSKMEMYNKKYGKEDRRRCKYFAQEYIYIQNLKTRVCFTLVVLFFMMIGALKIITENIVIPDSLSVFMRTYVNPYIIPWLIGCIIYTFISAWIYSRKYKQSKKRLKNYQKLLKDLDKYESSKEGSSNENY